MWSWIGGVILGLLSFLALDDTLRPEQAHAVEAEQRLRECFLDATRQGDRMTVDEFIRIAYDLNVQDDEGYTGLMLAAYHGHLDVVERLLAAGADPCMQNRLGHTALMLAIVKREIYIVQRLLDAACKADQPDLNWHTSMRFA